MFFESARERAFAQTVGKLSFTNPFLPERIALEEQALGDQYQKRGKVWYAREVREDNPNVMRICVEAEALAMRLRARLVAGEVPGVKDFGIYEQLVLYVIYYRYESHFYDYIIGDAQRITCYRNFREDLLFFFPKDNTTLRPPHLFACLFQVRRAFHLIFSNLIGSSMPMARLRADIWQSIFTHDLQRFQRALYLRMSDIPTLITGPSGTGKELVAQAIGMSRYIPFDEQRKIFSHDFRKIYHPLHITALSPTLVESELFGHKKGAFTGALGERRGHLERCPEVGAVFLDEIGEVDPSIQVKMLRLLQNRTFYRLGESEARVFRGRIIAATNRNLAREIKEGRFREDFFFRLCADRIHTPSLAEQLSDDFGELAQLVSFISDKVAGEEEGPALTREVMGFVEGFLGKDYRWPGNVRELEQCVRNILIRGHYAPERDDQLQDLAGLLLQQKPQAEALMNYYCALLYAQTHNFNEVARILNVDRRTVRSRVAAAVGGEPLKEG